MKKSFSMALAAILCVSGAFAVESDRPTMTQQVDTKEDIQLGAENIARIRSDYDTGLYSKFLRDMDHSYDEAIDKEQILALGMMRRGAVDLNNWFDSVKNIKDETNRELISAVSGLDNRFASKVRNVATADGLENLFVVYHQMQPGTGKNADENALISLDLEYEYKAIHLDLPNTDIQKDLNKQDLYYALKMEQMDKIMLAAQSFEDASLKSTIDEFAKNLDARLARHWDLMDLKKLSREKRSDPTEIRVTTILQSHFEKIQEIARAYLASNR
ncbi:MAG TPA: hypothetical protein VLE96_07375 [Chlamydiales bacterium]|nr:hypothetical protein [Chlamydiales bacterium]